MTHLLHHRKFERLVALFSAVAVLLSIMVVFAPAALAHHPEITAQEECDGALTIAYESVSWRTDGGSGSAHDNIVIEVQVNGTGSWTQVGTGAYNAGNNYRFSGSFDAAPYLGDDIVVRARAVGAWTNGQGGGETRQTSVIVVDLDCTETVAVSASPQACAIDQQGQARGAISFDIDPASGATVQVYANSNFSGPIGGALGDGVSLPLAPGTYYWRATASAGFELSGAATGSFTVAPCSASVSVSAGPCDVNPNGAPTGSVTVAIDPTSGATVVITGPGGPHNFSGSGGSAALAPGSYSWTASPGSGVALTGASSGSFTIDGCSASVSVNGVCQLDGEAGSGLIEVTITGSATVSIFDGTTLVDTVTTSGTVTVAEGATYSWSATPGAGYAMEGVTEGEIDIENCSRSLEIVVGGECRSDVPYLTWTVTSIGFSATETTITWLDIDPTNPLHSSVQPLSGEMIWPGAVVGGGKAIDWPGWLFVDKVSKLPVSLGTEGGTWITGSDGFEATRPVASIQFEVNPTAVVEVEYPGGEPTCAGPPDEVLGEEIDNDDPEVLPFTGFDNEVLLGASLLMLGSGIILIQLARRREEG